MALIPFQGNCPHNVNKDAKYHVKTNRGSAVVALVYTTAEGEKWHATTEEHPELVDMVNAVHRQARGVPNGSFYINEYKQVIVPNGISEQYYYAGKYEKPLRFEFEGHTLCGDHMGLDGHMLSPGSEWEGPHPGIPYILAAGGNDVYYRSRPRPNVTKDVKLSICIGRSEATQVAANIRQVKGFLGGRFYVNEFGAIFAPVSDENEINRLYVGRLDLAQWFPEPPVINN